MQLALYSWSRTTGAKWKQFRGCLRQHLKSVKQPWRLQQQSWIIAPLSYISFPLFLVSCHSLRLSPPALKKGLKFGIVLNTLHTFVRTHMRTHCSCQWPWHSPCLSVQTTPGVVVAGWCWQSRAMLQSSLGCDVLSTHSWSNLYLPWWGAAMLPFSPLWGTSALCAESFIHQQRTHQYPVDKCHVCCWSSSDLEGTMLPSC